MIQERSTGRSRGFGYVTFASDEDAKVGTNLELIRIRVVFFTYLFLAGYF